MYLLHLMLSEPPPQWAKLRGQAMQLHITLHCEDLGRINPTNAAICQGRPLEMDPAFFLWGRRTVGAFEGELNECLCYYMF